MMSRHGCFGSLPMVCPFHAQCQLAWVQCRQLLCDMGQRAPPFLVIGAGTWRSYADPGMAISLVEQDVLPGTNGKRSVGNGKCEPRILPLSTSALGYLADDS
ncbi:unnamed protein product [Effrenium voratum]|nr:unnamed protein product [Effrenium voratum]CAJ1458603.1 unnamed protein product [Effrenium voratum]